MAEDVDVEPDDDSDTSDDEDTTKIRTIQMTTVNLK